MSEPCRDRILLGVAALASSLTAWALWHFMGHEALDLLVLVALVCAVADNWRLRRALRRATPH
jgi:hypothetical protein